MNMIIHLATRLIAAFSLFLVPLIARADGGHDAAYGALTEPLLHQLTSAKHIVPAVASLAFLIYFFVRKGEQNETSRETSYAEEDSEKN